MRKEYVICFLCLQSLDNVLENQPQPASEVASLSCNAYQNRFNNIYPCKYQNVSLPPVVNIVLFADDHTRVVLKSDPNMEGSDYINASFIDVSKCLYYYSSNICNYFIGLLRQETCLHCSTRLVVNTCVFRSNIHIHLQRKVINLRNTLKVERVNRPHTHFFCALQARPKKW